MKCAHKPFSLNCIWILKFVWQFKRVLVPGNYHFFGKYFQNVVSLQNLRLLLSVLTYREGLSSNTVTLIEYFENITRNWIASRNASWTLLTKMQSPRENDARLSCRGNRIVISFLKTRGNWHIHYVFFLFQYITSYDFVYFHYFFLVPKENVMITKQKSAP